jgi:hypothetical protein
MAPIFILLSKLGCEDLSSLYLTRLLKIVALWVYLHSMSKINTVMYLDTRFLPMKNQDLWQCCRHVRAMYTEQDKE